MEKNVYFYWIPINGWDCISIYWLPWLCPHSASLRHAGWPSWKIQTLIMTRKWTTWFKWELSSQCTWRIVLTFYSKVNTNQVNEVKTAFVGSENEVVFRGKENCLNWQKELMIMRCLMVWWRRETAVTLS